MTKTMDTKSGLQLLVDLPEAVVKVRAIIFKFIEYIHPYIMKIKKATMKS